MLTKLTSFMRRNERSLIPAGLVCLLITSAALLVINKQGPQSLVPMPFEQLQRPEATAFKVGKSKITRRTLRAWQETGSRGLMQGPVYKAAIKRLPEDQRQVIQASLLDFCDRFGDELSGPDKDKFSTVCDLTQQTKQDQALKAVLLAMASAELLRRHKKPVAVELSAIQKSVMSRLVAQYGSRPLAKVGLSEADVQAAAFGQAATEILAEEPLQDAKAPTAADLQNYLDKNSSRYKQPALYDPVIIEFPDGDQATAASKELGSSSSKEKAKQMIKSSYPSAGVLPSDPKPITAIDPLFRDLLTSASPGDVLPAAFASYVWQVIIAGPVIPAEPTPPLASIEKQIRNDYLADRRNDAATLAMRRIEKRWGDQVLCDEEISSENPNLECEVLKP